MSDFFQNGSITTLHNLSRRPVEELEAELDIFSKQRPLSLVLPSLYSELSGAALPNIVKELAKVTYLSEIAVSYTHLTLPTMLAQCRSRGSGCE